MNPESRTIPFDLPIETFEKYSLLSTAMGVEPQQLIESVLSGFFEERIKLFRQISDKYEPN